MEFFLREIEKALDNELYFIALQSALTLPDICAALESPNGETTGSQYIQWYDTYAKEAGQCSISGNDCYRFRCSCLHQGSSQHPKSSYNRIMFVIPNSQITLHNNILNGALNIDVKIFCLNIIAAVRKWEQQIKQDPNFIKNYDKLIKVYPNGLSPYIGGIPVIS